MNNEFVWPNSVPVLTEGNFCRGTMHAYNNKHCLRGWINHVFTDVFLNTYVKNFMQNEVDKLTGSKSVIDYNDSTPVGKLSRCAKFWNKSMAKMGYTEGNPEKP